jgi:hypothetical protein
MGRDHWGDQGTDRRIVIIIICYSEYCSEPVGHHKMWGIPWPVE